MTEALDIQKARHSEISQTKREQKDGVAGKTRHRLPQLPPGLHQCLLFFKVTITLGEITIMSLDETLLPIQPNDTRIKACVYFLETEATFIQASGGCWLVFRHFPRRPCPARER